MVDPVQLRQKLAKHQIGPKYPGSMENAVQMVQERDAEILRHGAGADESDRAVRLGILSPEEIGYVLHNFTAQWEVPA